jgi:ADP-dependent NAD(P)H-hydrate dehydratase / NAD(P)H-hydrate epimerase
MRRVLSPSDNKYSRGIVAVAAGSERFPGAAVLTVGGARRGNAGYVKFLSQEKRLQDLVISCFPDVVPIENLDGERIDALVVGPGMGSVKKIPERIPLLLDGESIALATVKGFLDDHPITVITPHEGELRHCGVEVGRHLDGDTRKQIAQKIARDLGVIIVLKGHATVVAEPEGETFIDEIGGPELATAGSGDLLAGLIGSFLVSARDIGTAMDQVCRAVTLHSKAGRIAKEKYTSVTALEILESLAHV